MIKDFSVDKDAEIIKICEEINSLIPDIDEEGWHKRIVCDEKKYLKLKGTDISDELIPFPGFKKLIELASRYMKEAGFKSEINWDNTDGITVDAHYANKEYDDGESISSGFERHCDNDIGEEVITFICYYHVNCGGGGLEFYNPERTIDTNSNSEEIKCVVFSGTLEHCPAPITIGTRYAISVLIPTSEL